MKAYYRREMTEASMVQAVSPEMLLAVLKTPPSDPCFIKGPRGGLYQAVGGWEVKTAGPGYDYRDPLSERWVALFSSETRYLRPGSLPWMRAKMVLL